MAVGNGAPQEYYHDDEYQEIEQQFPEVEGDDDVIGSGDEEDKNDLFQQACLPVSGAPLPPSQGPPQDADEYLRQVQWERMHCPEVVEAKVEEQPARRKKKRVGGRTGTILAAFGCDELPADVQPRAEWTEDVADAFRDLRERCTENRSSEARVTCDVWRKRCMTERPSTESLAAQDFISVHHLVSAVVDLIAAAQDEEAGEAGAPFSSDGGQLAEWAFAALLFIEEPLVDEIQFQLQRLRRACRKALVAAAVGRPAAAAAPPEGSGASAAEPEQTTEGAGGEGSGVAAGASAEADAEAGAAGGACAGKAAGGATVAAAARGPAAVLLAVVTEVFGQR